VTHLRKMMLEELQRRHYSESTTPRYIRFIERFAQHFHCSPCRLGPQHIREYQAQLFIFEPKVYPMSPERSVTCVSGTDKLDMVGPRGRFSNFFAVARRLTFYFPAV